MSKSVWLLFKPSWLVRTLYRYHRGYGLNFGTVSLSFYRLSFHNCLSCVLNCDDLLTIPFEVYLINCIFTVLNTCLIFFDFWQIIKSSLALWLIFFSICMFVTESSKECWYTKSCRIYKNSKYAIQVCFYQINNNVLVIRPLRTKKIQCLNSSIGQFWVKWLYTNILDMALRLQEIRQRKWSIYPWISMWFLLFYSPQPES